jgi:hypothetical protein
MVPAFLPGCRGEESGIRALIALRNQRLGPPFEEKELPGKRGHKAGGHPDVRPIMQRHPETEPLPLHAAAKNTITSADDPIRFQEKSRTYGIGAGRH